MEAGTFGRLITAEVLLLFGLHAAANAVRGVIQKPHFPHDDVLHI